MLAGLFLSTSPALADTSPVTSSVDKTTAVVGDTVTVTVTFTNPDASPITFDYLSVYGTYPTWSNSALIWTFTGCTGDVSWCAAIGTEGDAMHHNVPIAPGESRTATLTYQIASNSACGNGIAVGLDIYSYREDAQGNTGQIYGGPVTYVNCA